MSGPVTRSRGGANGENQPPRTTIGEKVEALDQSITVGVTDIVKQFEAKWNTYKSAQVCCEKKQILSQANHSRQLAESTLLNARGKVKHLNDELNKAVSEEASALVLFERSDNNSRRAEIAFEETQATADQDLAVKEEEFMKHLENMMEQRRVHKYDKEIFLHATAFADTLSFGDD